MDASTPSAGAYRFSGFTLDLARGALLGADGVAIPLRPKSFALLRLLVEQAGRLLDRDTIMAAVWPDVVVGDESITQCVRDIRKALGDEAQALLQTVPKRGYLLAAEATALAPPPSATVMPRLERRLAAIMAADIVGYSRLIEEDEAATLAALKGLRQEVIDPLLAEHKGRIVKLMGDGALVEFGSVVDAVACAVAVQHGVAEQQAGVPAERRIVFRIGINLGDVVVEGEDLLGDGVNIAARLEQLCEPGGVLISGTAYDHLQGRLGLPIEDAGEQQVKNIARPVRSYRVRLEGSAKGWRPPRTGGRPSHRWPLTAAAALFVVLFLGGIWHFWPTEPPPGKPGIAVLPFDNYGGDEATGRLADGITEDIITDLARFRELDVIARNSTEVYKGKAVDVREVGRALGVSYVLEGSIQRQTDQVRVTAQLIDAASGAHVWSERWDRPVKDVFAVQSEMADTVAGRLGGFGVIERAEHALAKRKRPADLNAYDLYLLGIERKHRMTKESEDEAIRLLKQAVDRDPQLARAWTGLSWAYNLSAGFAASPEEGNLLYRQALEAAMRAVQLDPADAEAHDALGEAIAMTSGDLARAQAEIEQALTLNPSGSMPLFEYAGWASAFGKPEEGAEAADRLIRIDPTLRAISPGGVAYAYFMVGRYEDALHELTAKSEDSLNQTFAVIKAGALAMLDRGDEAKAVATRMMSRFPTTIEGFVNRPEWADHERKRLAAAMAKAGFPACLPAGEIAQLARPFLLPECEAERAKMAATKS